MNDRITNISLYTRPAGFSTRSKGDAKRFLTELIGIGSYYVFNDLNNPNYRYIITRPERRGDLPAVIAHELKPKSIFVPDLMYSDDDAIEMAFAARKSINKKFFSDEE